MPRLPFLAVAVFLAAALTPQSAQAAFAPKLAIRVDPATPDTPTALTSTITQAGGETPIRRVRLALPSQFGPAFGSTLKSCSDAERAARACPEESRMGTARAQTMLGTFEGTVHYGPVGDQGPRIFVFLSNGVALLDQSLEGVIRVTAKGFETVFDGLPDVETSSFELALEGAPKTLLSTPRDCGTYVFAADFTSQDDESATAESPVEIAPCRNFRPRIGGIGVKGRSLRFRLSEPAQVAVAIRRGGRTLSRKSVAGIAGRNTVRIRRPSRGRYRVVLRATDPGGLTGVASRRLRRR